MSATTYVRETRRALSRRGVSALLAVMFVIAGTTWGSRGFAMAVAVLLVGLGCGMTVLVVLARASVHSGPQ